MADPGGIIVRAVDRIEHPAKTRNHRDRRLGGREFLAEKLILGKLTGDGGLDVFRNGDVDGGHLGAVIFDLTAGPPELPVHQLRLGEHGLFRCFDSFFRF